MGLRFDDMDYYTPRDIHNMLKIKEAEERDKLNAIMYGAWHTEAFARTKKLPKLDKCMLKPEKKVAKKSIDECIEFAKNKGLKVPNKGGEIDGGSE